MIFKSMSANDCSTTDLECSERDFFFSHSLGLICLTLVFIDLIL